MSSKSSGHTEVHTRTLLTRKFILLAVIAVAAMFFITITYYPLIFNSENRAADPVPAPPSTPVK